MEITIQILRVICVLFIGGMVGFFSGLSLKNHSELKMHKMAICKLIEELEDLKTELRVKKLTTKIEEMVFGDDKPEDLEKAIKEVAEAEGFEAAVIKKKVAKKTTKKTNKKENK